MKIKTISIVLLLALAATLSVMYYERQPALDLGPVVIHHDSKLPVQAPVAVTQQNSSASSTLEMGTQTASSTWQSYNNSQYGIEIQIPPSDKLTFDSQNTLQLDAGVINPNLPDQENFVFGFDATFFPVSNESQQQRLMEFANVELGEGSIVSSKFINGGLLATLKEQPLYAFFLLNGDKSIYFYSAEDYFSTSEFLNILSSLKLSN